MGRKPKCTVEEKISAVEDYLNGIRSVSEIMVEKYTNYKKLDTGISKWGNRSPLLCYS